MSESRAFTSRYKRGMLAGPGFGCVIAPLILAPWAAMGRSILAGLAIAAATLALSFLVASLLRRRRPALGLTEAGVHLDGLAAIPWEDVVSVRRDLDRPRAGQLILRLRKPLADFLPRPGPGFLGPAPLWRPAATDSVLIRADLLEDPVEDTEGAFRYFLGR